MQAETIDNETEQKEVAEKIKEVTETNSEVMNSDDVKNTAEIIDTLLQFEQEEEKLDDEVRRFINILILSQVFTDISLLNQLNFTLHLTVFERNSTHDRIF